MGNLYKAKITIKTKETRAWLSIYLWYFKDVLEKKIEDLSRQLTNEKQQHRKEKQQVAKLQRELARAKSDSQKFLTVSVNL